jgi:hypothetical protein
MIRIENFIELITAYYPGVEVASHGETYGDIMWLNSDPIPEAELDGLQVASARSVLKDLVNEYRDDKINNGFWFQGNLYDTNSIARTNASSTVAAVAAGMPIPAGFTWRDLENNNVPMNAQKVVMFGISMLAYVSGLYKYSWDMKASVDLLTTVQAVQDFDYTVGWPSRNSDNSAPVGRD